MQIAVNNSNHKAFLVNNCTLKRAEYNMLSQYVTIIVVFDYTRT